MKTVAVIPVKKKSERVDNKNFRTFVEGRSLLEFKIKQVVESDAFDEVYVSSNSEEAAKLAEQYSVRHLFREEYYCNNTVIWSDVIHHVVDSIPESDDVSVAWCHTTSPLFSRYKQAVDFYKSMLSDGEAKDGLIAVSEFSEFLLTEKARPYNYNWGVWHDYSQYMEKLYRVTGALFLAQKSMMLKNRYVISKNPHLYVTTAVEGLDIDTNLDFILAQKFYEDPELRALISKNPESKN